MAASSGGSCSALRAWKRLCVRVLTFCSGALNACVTAAAVPRTRTPWALVETIVRPRAASAFLTAAMSAGFGPNCAMKSSGCSHCWYFDDVLSCSCWISVSSWAWLRSGR